jgi:cephalosporin hydroxylase
MQELICKTRPKVIVETGVYLGGTAVFYASLLHLLGAEGRVIGIDVELRPQAIQNVEASAFRERIRLVQGDSKSEALHEELQTLLGGERNVLVCLDSDHSYAHTLAELRLFSRYVPVGGYVVMFDTICEELADTPRGSPEWRHDNPLAAVREFLAENADFEIDPAFGKFLVSFAPRGFLRRKS